MSLNYLQVADNLSNGCHGSHQFWFAGTCPDGRLPEGFPCVCGETIAHYEQCSECGQWKFLPKSRAQKEPAFGMHIREAIAAFKNL